MKNVLHVLAGLSLGALLVGCGDGSPGAKCGEGTELVDGVCVGTGANCAAGTVEDETGNCVPDGSVICESGTTFNTETGTCDPDISGCSGGTVLIDGECRDPAEVTADVSEAPEPNDPFGGTPGTFELPTEGNDLTISGCIEPFEVEGETVADFDSYVFVASAPTLLDITVDGFGGAAGAFQLESLEDPLIEAGYSRFGINLANDLSKRQVFLPVPGAYLISFADSRSIFAGPAGGPGACYLATIETLAIPTPSPLTLGTAVEGTIEAETQFFSIGSAQDGIFFSNTDAPGDAAMVDSVLMINNEYFSSNPGFGQRGFGDPASNLLTDAEAADALLYVVDPVINISLAPVPYEHLVDGPTVVQLPSAGETVSVPHTGDPNTEGPQSALVFEVSTDGDLKVLDIDASAISADPDQDWFIVDSDLNFVATIATFDVTAITRGTYQLPAGTYYIIIQDFSADEPPANFDVTATQTDITPVPVVVNTPATALPFVDEVDSYMTITPGAFEWWDVAGSVDGGDFLNLDIFESSIGQLDVDIVSVGNLFFDAGDEFNQVISDANPQEFLLRLSTENPLNSASYDFSVSDTSFTDLGAFDSANPISNPVVGGGASENFLAQGVIGNTSVVSVTGQNGFDPVLIIRTPDGDITVDETGADGVETVDLDQVITQLPFTVTSVAETGGDYTIGAVSEDRIFVTSAPNAPIFDNSDFSDSLTVGETCTIQSIRVDMDISHTFIGDIILDITSPTGTVIRLQDEEGGAAEDIVGTYPTTLTPNQSLDGFAGEEASGTWTLSGSDNAAVDQGTLNSWGVTIVCAP